ncbi:hypothetical protein QR680_002489 [Steinernema hermaphroditum]|uniref:Saposin B-type domain-containing protein n=1 Tax=Steinernema hermaphroditum TaxID=289476 RepID=A0AA39LI78_9BILA|nr:hypothetical protein QR680_002489 [Steinernema hermaphroditum]
MRFARLILFIIILSAGQVRPSLHFDKNYGYGSYSRNFLDGKADNSQQTSEPSSTSNLGCFLCTQMLSVTKQRAGLSQPQLKIILNDRCKSLPIVVRNHCFAFVGESLPQLYSALTHDMSHGNLCEMLSLCDSANPFAIENSQTTPKPPSTPSTTAPTDNGRMDSTKKMSTKPYNILTTTPRSTSRSTQPPPHGEKKPEFEELLSKNGNNTTTKRLTCLFCERMLSNAKNYALAAKSEIAAFASAGCSKLREPPLIEQCYQLTDRKINELAIFVDEQVVEALWCAQMNRC